MSPPSVVRAVDLTKYYGRRKGVDGISFSLQPGEVIGFLGPNGSGKTTVLRMLVGLIGISRGHAELFGHSVAASSPHIRSQVGYLPGTLGLYNHLTGRQLFHHLGALRKMDVTRSVDELCQRFALDPDLHIKTMSKGTRQKVGLIQAFMHLPMVLILDEPTSGLDPLVQHEFKNLLHETQQRGASIILSSHVLSEVQSLAQRVIILKDGRLLANETVDSLPGLDVRDIRLEFDHPVLQEEFQNIAGFQFLSCSDNRVSGRTSGSQRPLLEAALRNGVVRVQSPEPSLDEIFRHLIRSEEQAERFQVK